MRHVHNKTSRRYFLFAIVSSMVLLAYIGAQTMSMPRESKTYKESNSVIETTTSLILETTTIPETTTTVESVVETTTTHTHVPRTTITEPYVVTTVPEQVSSGSVGPPHNTTSLVGCISYYESRWGADPNVFQFQQGTWEAYGGTGSPSNAPYWRQEEIFWLAWEDAGHHHWLAQKGRCF